jgi:hypothetical protein
MFVTCNSHNCYRLIKGCIYKAIKETDTEYYIKLSKDVTGIYNKKDFTPTREEVMKIKEWKELHGKEPGGYWVHIYNNIISVTKNCEEYLKVSRKFSNDQIIAHLALLGIEVEFEKETTITQNDYNYLKAITDDNRSVLCSTIIKKPFDCVMLDGVYLPCTIKLFCSLVDNEKYLVSDLLKMKVEG